MSISPGRIYRGTFRFYLKKTFITLWALFGIVLLPLILISVQWDSIRSEPPQPDWPLAVFSIFAIVSGFFVGWCMCLPAYPMVGVSNDGLWFNHTVGWTVIPWAAISFIDEPDTPKEDVGLFVYSNNLSSCHRFNTVQGYTRSSFLPSPLHARVGRAIFISPHLRDFKELKATIYASAILAERPLM